MDFRIVLHGKLREHIVVGVFDEKELAALTNALNDRMHLIEVQKHRVQVADGEVLALIDVFGLIFAVIIGVSMVFAPVSRGDHLDGSGGAWKLLQGTSYVYSSAFGVRRKKVKVLGLA